MRIVIIDGQGGGLGRSVVEQVRQALPETEIIAVGANALATQAMLKAGATAGATGESAVRYNCARADVIVGALGIAFSGSMHGEIGPAIARSVSESDALKLLIPVSRCAARVVGTAERSVAQHVAEAVEALRVLAEEHYQKKR
jgi:prephenate dehydrogenase